MKFPLSPDEAHEFYQFLHMHSIGYDFDGGYKIRRETGMVHGLWYVEDSIQYRLTDEGMWIGCPREDDKVANWISDTSHEFRDAYELLLRCGCSAPALRRPRPSPARVP